MKVRRCINRVHCSQGSTLIFPRSRVRKRGMSCISTYDVIHQDIDMMIITYCISFPGSANAISQMRYRKREYANERNVCAMQVAGFTSGLGQYGH
jgi:hypothetical protein